MKRKNRIEIKIVTDAGTVEYKHVKGDPQPDGQPSAGPSDEDFAQAQALVLKLLGVWPPKPDDPARPHIVLGQFQSDKYPTCPRGKVPLSVKDPTAQDLLWQYAQRRRAVDAQFADDLEWALVQAGYMPT